MVNVKHRESDVIAGAGFGILLAHLAYLSHRNCWGRKPIGRDVGLMPSGSPAGGTGFALTWRPNSAVEMPAGNCTKNCPEPNSRRKRCGDWAPGNYDPSHRMVAAGSGSCAVNSIQTGQCARRVSGSSR